MGGLCLSLAIAVACGLEQGGLLSDGGLDGGGDAPGQSDAVAGMPDDSGPDSPADTGAPDAFEAGPVDPGSLTSLELWLRSDNVVADGGVVLSWPDQSGKNDKKRDALPKNGNEPGLFLDAGYNWPVLSFFAFNGNTQAQWLQTGAWTGGPFTQPTTVMVVGEGAKYFLDSVNPSQQFAVVTVMGGLRSYAGNYLYDAGPTSGKSAIIAVFSGASSEIHNSQNSATAKGNPGSNGFAGMTIGNYAQPGPSFTLAGYLAEVAVWSRLLTPLEIVELNLYSQQRYGISIAP